MFVDVRRSDERVVLVSAQIQMTDLTILERGSQDDRMDPQVFNPQWIAADVDAEELWASSGGQWLTAAGVGVPTRLVQGVAGLTDFLDVRGAGLAALLGARGLGVVAERAAVLGMRRSGDVSCGGASRLFPTLDGWVAVSLARREDVASIPAWLGVDADPVTPWGAVRSVLRGRTSAEVVDQAVMLGLPCCEVNEVMDRRPVLVQPLGDAAPRPLAGLVVANLAPLWAGPIAGDVLARLGARVIKVESVARPDGARRTGPFFEALHGRCESLALDLRSPSGHEQLRTLLAQVDVVIEGSRPRALQQMGIEAADLTRAGPRIWLSITGHGRSDPLGRRVGFGDDAAAAGGLVGWIEDSPVFTADAVADPITGLTGAATAVQLVETGGRWLVDVALSRVAASMSQPARSRRTAPSTKPSMPQRRADPGASLPIGRDNEILVREFDLNHVNRRRSRA